MDNLIRDYLIKEFDNFKVYLLPNQYHPCHSYITPKNKKYRDFFQLPENERNEASFIELKLAEAIKIVLNSKTEDKKPMSDFELAIEMKTFYYSQRSELQIQLAPRHAKPVLFGKTKFVDSTFGKSGTYPDRFKIDDFAFHDIRNSLMEKLEMRL
jgi:hypothetical protein